MAELKTTENWDENISKKLEGIQLTENRLIVKRLKIEKSKGGILLVENENPDYFNAMVYMVGPGKYDPQFEKVIPMTIKVGDIVTCQARCYQPLMIEGEELTILKEGDLVFYRTDGKQSMILWK